MTDDLKIFILEDNPSDADLLLRELKKSAFGFTYEIVQTREAFENGLQNFNPDIILSDYSLPTFDGVTAFHIKQKIAPEIPFIIISGTVGEENAVELIKYGVTDCIEKDKLFTLNQKIVRALKEAGEKKEKRNADEKLRVQNEKLFEIAFLQSHQIRRPVANILGLIGMFNQEDPGDAKNLEVLSNLEIAAKDLDNVIHEIVLKTSEI
jgi:DNA-binding NtrC family response regulator